MDVGDENDGTLVGDLCAEAAIGERPPLGGVQHLVGIGYQAVALEVRGESHEKHSKHGMAAVPALSICGHTKTTASKLGVGGRKFNNGVAHGVHGHDDS